MKKTILALTIATLSIGAYANTYDADKTLITRQIQAKILTL